MSTDEATRTRIEEKLTRARVPGCSLALVDSRGQVQSDAFGSADLRNNRPTTVETIYHLFSGTKLFTAAALMLLQERGVVSLDEPITTYLDDLPLRHPVTVRQLASHNSGLRDTLRGFFAVHRKGESSVSTAEALTRYRLDHGKPPGRGAAYRNVNYAILGELISRVSGQPYPAFVTDALLAPLGADVAFEYGNETDADEAVGYIDRWSPMRGLIRLLVPGLLQRIEGSPLGRRVELSSVELDTAAIGGLVGTARDFAPFLVEMLSPSDGVLSAKSKSEMLTLHARGAAGIVSREGVGLAWKKGIDFWNHEGGGPGFTSETRLYPAERLGMTLLMNVTQRGKWSRFAHDLCEMVRRFNR